MLLIVKVYEGPTKGGEQQKKGSQYQKGVKDKHHEVKQPNEEIRDNISLG